MSDRTNEPDREIPEPLETDTRRATGMGEAGSLPSDDDGGRESGADAAAAGGAKAGSASRDSAFEEAETRRATGMGEPGTLPSDRGAVAKARKAASGRLEEAAGRVRELGERAASKNKLLAPTRSVAYNAAEGIDSAAEYVRTREIDAMRTDLESTVRRHPLASVAVAFMAGYTLRRIF